ncbi:MAG: hypothetical protein MUC97_04425 [Bernardetiaceae bacterium]|jgi:hypothetical protein|nr:hypothetical protein [Bernardetiaceae bacterium]
MKKLLLWVLIGLRTCVLWGQQTRQENLPLGTNENLFLNLRFADSIRVSAWDKNEVSITVVYQVNQGKLNEAFQLAVSRSEGQLRVTTDFDKELMKNGQATDCPEGQSTYQSNVYVDAQGNKTYRGSTVCAQIYFDIKVPRLASFRVETISGNLLLVGLGGGVEAKSISGFVDLAWPANQGAELRLKTITGQAYSNLPIDFGPDRQAVGHDLRGTLAGGGPRIRLETISGDIYLRQAR